MISINDAVDDGLTRLRKPNWAHPYDHIEIASVTELPLAKLYSPAMRYIIDGMEGGMSLKLTDFVTAEWQEYFGPTPGSKEWKRVEALFIHGRGFLAPDIEGTI